MNQFEKNALEYFNSGYNCAQSVLSAYSSHFNIENNLAMSISSGFGAGMGQLQETCGAVTGAFMVIGLFNSEKYADNASRKEASYAMIQEFSKKFEFENSTIKCSTLLNCDLKTVAGQSYFNENNLSESICEKCISDSIQIINKLIKV